jgi:hypothetical protein
MKKTIILLIGILSFYSCDKEEKEVRLYITSSQANAEVIGKGVRSHWVGYRKQSALAIRCFIQ